VYNDVIVGCFDREWSKGDPFTFLVVVSGRVLLCGGGGHLGF
jgi:hypothetical protein